MKPKAFFVIPRQPCPLCCADALHAFHLARQLGIHFDAIVIFSVEDASVLDDLSRRFADESTNLKIAPVKIRNGTGSIARRLKDVSTTLGAEGIPCVSGTHLVRADTPMEFATGVVRLLNDEAARKRLGKKAADWVGNHFDWSYLSKKIHAEMAPLL